MVERGSFQMTLWKRLGMKYAIEITYCTTTPSLHHTANDSDIRMYFKEKKNDEIQK